MPGTEFGYTLNLKTLIPFKVQHPLPSIGLDLYQLGVHIRAKKNKKKKKFRRIQTGGHPYSDTYEVNECSHKKLTASQCDQIGQFFAHWATF